MDLSPHLATLRTDLSSAAAVGGPDVARAAALLGDAVEPALRLLLLDLLTEAAAELTPQLGGVTVELRLRGREPELVATGPEAPRPGPDVPDPDPDLDPRSESTRLTLRLPDHLKTRAENTAFAAGLSLNSWLVRTVATALEPPSFPSAGGQQGPRRLTGFGRA